MKFYRKKFFSNFHQVALVEDPHLFPFVACSKAAVLRPWQEMVGQPGEGSFFPHVEDFFPLNVIGFFEGHLGWDGVAIFWVCTKY